MGRMGEVGEKTTISVIIPVLNEAERLAIVLENIRAKAELETIVVDGGSQDATVDVAKSFGVKVIPTLPGRAQQMNQGAISASGNILLFLHGDTLLPPDFAVLVRQTLAKPGVVAGAFELGIDAQGWQLRLVEWLVKWRSRLLQLPYGDQAIFLKSSTFQAMGGFPELPIMEDFELIRRLQRVGKIAIAPASVITSGRRWQKLGVVRTTLINQGVILAYFLGVSPTTIVRWYRRKN